MLLCSVIKSRRLTQSTNPRYTPRTMPTARDIALRALLLWTTPSDPPFLPERTDPEWNALGPRDRAFAFDLLTGIIRWRATLDAIIASRLRQPLDLLDHPVRAVLWIGAYQLLFQSGTADYAAVDTTVNLAKQNRGTTKAAGLVNAVLRGITRLSPVTAKRADASPAPALSRRAFALDFDSQLFLNNDLFPDPTKALAAHLAVVRSHPVSYVNHLRKIYGDDLAGELLLRNNLRPVVTLRADSGSIDVPTNAGLIAHADTPRFLVAAEGWNPMIEAFVGKGLLSPQDPTSAKPVRRAAELASEEKIIRPARILDLCAGLGTKSVQLARAFPRATVIAADIDDVKLQRLAARATQIGQKNITITPAATIAAGVPGTEKFDLVFVDVPCSNTGVMAKRVQSRWRWPSLDHTALHTLQTQLLMQGFRLLAPGGTLIYSTCSLDPAENESLVAAFLAGLPGALRVAEQEATLPALTTRADTAHDGGYFAILVKEAPPLNAPATTSA